MAGWGQGFFEGAGTLAGSIGEGLLAALRPDDPRDRNPTGLTSQQFAALQRGESVTPPQRPGLGESLLGLTPVPSLIDAWKASDTAGDGGYEGGRATGTALATLATLALPGGKALRAETRAPIRAYHGSPHSFDRFDASRIGTGEGAQAYGHGIYLAENENVAKSYKTAGQGPAQAALQYEGQNVVNIPAAQFDALPELTRRALVFARGDANIAQAVHNATAGGRADIADEIMRLHFSGKLGQSVPPQTGHMYEVGIHADPARFLDWDKPLSAQGDVAGRILQIPAVAKQQAAQTAILGPDKGLSGSGAYASAANWRRGVDLSPPNPAQATATLSEAGIPGIRYLDQGSRSAGQGSSNYVVFPGNEKLIEILRKYGLLPAAALPAAAVPGLLSQPGEQ